MNSKFKVLLNKLLNKIGNDCASYKRKTSFKHFKDSLRSIVKNNSIEKRSTWGVNAIYCANIKPITHSCSSRRSSSSSSSSSSRDSDGEMKEITNKCIMVDMRKRWKNSILQNCVGKYGILNGRSLFILIAICGLYEILNSSENKNKNRNDNENEKKKKKKNVPPFGLLNKAAHCCGIMAYVGNRDASKILIDGIEILQNRGYDSCGISTISNKNVLRTTKYASSSTSDAVEKLRINYMNNHKNDSIGIAHTRWATHGSKTDENAHPHMDYDERISIVHNGIIENYRELKNFLLKNKIPFKSNTDTEVVANLIGYYLDQKENFENAVVSTIKQLEGTWSFCIIHKDYPDQMILAANGSPLHIGFKDNEIFVASEHSALFMFTNEYISLKDGEILSINKNNIDDLKILKKVESIPEVIIQKTPHPFPHWTIKEIHEQSISLSKSLNNGGRFSILNNSVKLGGLDPYVEDLSKIENILLIGCGTSYYAALYAKYIMNYLNCFNTVQVIDPIDFNISVIPKEKEGIIFISQSGETRDVIKACKLADDLNLKKLSVINSVGSTIANMTGRGVYVNAGREVGVASTKCFTSEVSVLTLIALWFFQNKKNYISNNKISSLINSLHRLPLYADTTIKSCENICKLLSYKLSNAKSILIIGNGLSYPIALEGALKIKELTYIHSEGFTGSSLKHGPYALLGGEDNIPVIMLVFNDNTKTVMINTGEQIKSRGAHIICLTDDENLCKHFADDIILIPNNGLLTPLLGVIPLQMMAYYTSVNKGNNPDKPRCLAKTVTVS
ncbi:glutamine--fructose-6-phosphate aminotransferase [isomerizing], putative [Plasmodium malariae]|uniref:Glutamine--fructose-6-phosphate aminotransferase [isomerizing] n=1 Tax=Plasmodium malariae TaxID=5858 RepID=A0A1A8VVA2_PLAMA|nr:glutamine--fructose-6-phosphate aminotransferase [isomerizing], putative [Plasmodium malariae]SBS83276.1 glutamine--fructose-6-phosphate aminotransferase [isomerizing], putative [Plasmodium malariae]SCN45027.1 glutamine--fructose-6-phosphate aminotransferase [isomerizing], putative [Plasmodium malariae]